MKRLNKKTLLDFITTPPGHYSFGLLDLSTQELIGHNVNHQVHSASVIKLFYLYAALKLVNESALDLESCYVLKKEEIVDGCGVLKLLEPGRELSLKDLLYLMIDVSDNTATNMLFDIIGKERLNQQIQSIGANNTCAARKLMRVVPGLYSYTTIEDTFLVLRHLVTKESLPINLVELSKDILAKQQMNDLLSYNWKDSIFYHKTGEIEGVVHDAGMVKFNNRQYLIAMFSSELPNNRAAKRHFNQVGNYLFKALNQEASSHE